MLDVDERKRFDRNNFRESCGFEEGDGRKK
jgi:hypothetical protein